jgi:iron complex outermembrane receptor protein
MTKRATDDPLTRLTTSYIGRAQFGTHLDVGRRFGEQNEWGVRVNGAWRNGEASIDDGRQRVGVGAIGLDYAGNRLRWSLDAFTQREHVREFRPQIGFAAGIPAIPDAPSARTNFYPGTELDLRDSTVASRLEYDLTDRVTAYAGIGYRDGAARQTFPGTLPGRAANALGDFRVNNAFYDSYSETTSADVGLRARFDTGAIRHTLTVGASTLAQESGNAYVTSTASPVDSNIYRPAPIPPVNAARTEPRKASDTSLQSIAIADTLSFADDRLLVTLGLRDQTVELENFNTTSGLRSAYYKRSAISPLAGVVFKPLDNVSLYGNYTEGLTRGGTAPASAANAGETFPPYKSEQYEAGVKVDWGTVTTTASVFQISKPNALTDPATNLYSFDGEQRNRGLELSAYGELQRGLRVMASAAFNDGKLTRTTGGVNQGNDAPGVPDRTFNLGVDWDVPAVPGLSLNGRVINTSKTYFNAANSLQFPSWTRYDIGARYRLAVSGKPVVLRANIENLMDKNYWLQSGTYATVGAPRTLVLSASIDF